MKMFIAVAVAALGLLVSATASAAACPTAPASPAVIQCLIDDQKLAAAEQVTYLAAAQERITRDLRSRLRLAGEQKQWAQYRDAHCKDVYAYWAQGSIREAKRLQCSVALTRERTHDLWQAYLGYEDATPAILPEPGGAK